MVSLNFQNLLKINQKHGLNENEITSKSLLIKDFLEKIEQKNQGFYKIIDDQLEAEKIINFANSKKTNFKHIVVLGIGGSALGTICLQQSLTHLFKSPTLHVIDNIDPVMIKELEDIIDISQTLFIVVSKSGGTMETLSQYGYFQKNLEDNGLEINKHMIFITDPQKGHLRKIAKEKNITTFDIPENTGGRFSVLTAVGLLPAALIGIDIKKLIKGAQYMRDNFLNHDIEKNLAFTLAVIQYLLGQKGKTINVMMPYAQKLIRLADWYRQLLAESIGKEGTGLTPINALGVTDQHSQSQLYNDGPNDKLIIFIEPEKTADNLEIPNPLSNDPNFKFMNNQITFNKLIQMEKQGTEESLTQNNRPNITINIDKIDEETLGELFMLLQGSIAFLGEFYKINAFDQPGVELSKKITKELLIKEYGNN